MAIAPGTRSGPDEVAGQIGSGGIGEVYRATDTSLKRQVAIKCCRRLSREMPIAWPGFSVTPKVHGGHDLRRVKDSHLVHDDRQIDRAALASRDVLLDCGTYGVSGR